MSFLTCLVRSHKSKTLLPSLPSLLPFPFLLLSRSVDPPAPPRRLRLPRVLRAFPRLALSSSPCVGLPHLAYAPVHALNSYLLSHASSWLFLCAPVLPFELMGPLYSYAEFRVACSRHSCLETSTSRSCALSSQAVPGPLSDCNGSWWKARGRVTYLP